MKNKKYKHVLGNHFQLERNNYFSTFTINIESLLIHLINICICFASKYILIPHFSCIPKDFYILKYLVFVSKLHNQIKVFSTFKHNIFQIKILANVALTPDLCMSPCNIIMLTCKYLLLNVNSKSSIPCISLTKI